VAIAYTVVYLTIFNKNVPIGILLKKYLWITALVTNYQLIIGKWLYDCKWCNTILHKP